MALLLDDIDTADFYERFSARLSQSQDELAAFLSDPTGFSFKTVGIKAQSDLGRKLAALPASQVSQGNAFLLTMLANPGFVDWMRGYNQKMSSMVAAVDLSTSDGQSVKHQVIEDFARAMIDYGELRLFTDMVRAGGDRSVATTLDADSLATISAWYDGIAVEIETFIYAVAAVAVAALITVVAIQIDLTIPVEVPQQARTAMTANEVRNLSQLLLDHAQELYGQREDE